jgi:hypothetical protein
MVMPTIGFGVFLVVLGLVGLVASGGSPTAAIPSVLGIIFFLGGVVAHKQAGMRKHVMHGMAALGLLTLLAGASRLGPLLGGGEAGLAVIINAVMAVAALVYVALAVNSFIQARRARQTSAA